MPADIEKYHKYVKDFDLTQTQQAELIQTVWKIMENFVDQAFGLYPVQQSRGYLPKGDLQSPARRVKLCSLSHRFMSVAVNCGG